MKTVFISGGSRGIGRQMTMDFCSKGYKVLFCYEKSAEQAAELEKEMEKAGYSCKGYRLDISDSRAVGEFFKNLFNIETIDVLINNAGIALEQKMLIDTSIDEWRRLFDVNVNGVFNLTKEIASKMIYKGYGRIINVASIWGVSGGSCEVCYSATKGAIISFTKALAKELASANITVNCISPGVIDTDMNGHLNSLDKQALVEQTPISRLGQPNDVSKLALFLADEDAGFITGQNIIVDGGYIL